MSAKQQAPSGERLAKVIARAGVCSRREAETWISAGRVAVNGSTVKTPAFNVVESDAIVVDGKPVAQRQATQLWLYHKPAGLMVTEKDPEGRPTVFEAFARLGLPRVLTVGRLDFNTEGLLLLTNDGGLKRTLELPATGWVRRYRVRAFGKVTKEQLDTLREGITVEGIAYGPIEAEIDGASGANQWLTLALREGKNREVRTVLGALGLEVNRLIRLSYGPFQLGDLPAGAVEKVKTRILKDQLGKRLADSAGADFDSPVAEDPLQPRRRTPPRPEKGTVERDRFGGLRRRTINERPSFEAAPRTVHFDDGRPAQSFVPGQGRKDRNERGGKPFEKGARRDGDTPFAKRDRPEGAGAEGKRPFKRRDDRSFGKDGDRPQRAGGDKPFKTREDRPFRKDGDRLGRSGGDTSFKPRGDRTFGRDGDRPQRPGGARSSKPGEGRPFRNDGDRPQRPGGDKPFKKREDRPFRKDGDRPFAKGPRRDGDKPFAKGPSRDSKPFAKGPRPERDGAAGKAVRKDRPARPRRKEDE